MAALGDISRLTRLLFRQTQRSPSIFARCSSQAASQPKPVADDHEAVSPTFVNRNPRNLEQMALAVKDRGWRTTWPHREYYHRLVLTRSNHHVTAEVFHSDSPSPVVSCSTKEWAVKRELYSTRSVAACQAVGEVLAQRCHQAGVTHMVFHAIPWQFRSSSVQSFWTALKDGGLTLSEPRRKYIGV
ncbi:hypothetical protein CRUP_009848 [Coryphaenoides rupestris]|nr:hypothetical protein CRUP_009848 [Coryphaenoides rupestris]